VLPSGSIPEEPSRRELSRLLQDAVRTGWLRPSGRRKSRPGAGDVAECRSVDQPPMLQPPALDHIRYVGCLVPGFDGFAPDLDFPVPPTVCSGLADFPFAPAAGFVHFENQRSPDRIHRATAASRCRLDVACRLFGAPCSIPFDRSGFASCGGSCSASFACFASSGLACQNPGRTRPTVPSYGRRPWLACRRLAPFLRLGLGRGPKRRQPQGPQQTQSLKRSQWLFSWPFPFSQ